VRRGLGVQAWAEKSTALSMNVLKKNLDSYKVRVTSNIVCEAVEKNDTHYLSKVFHLRRFALSLILCSDPMSPQFSPQLPSVASPAASCAREDVGGHEVQRTEGVIRSAAARGVMNPTAHVWTIAMRTRSWPGCAVATRTANVQPQV
jgi:hypothetical protein